MTRWHDDDLTGRLLKKHLEESGENWDLLNLPAVAEQNDPLGREPGEALWPSRYPLSELAGIQGAVGDDVWLPLYQQKPLLGAAETARGHGRSQSLSNMSRYSSSSKTFQPA